MNRTPWWASWMDPATTRSYGWGPSCGGPPSRAGRPPPAPAAPLGERDLADAAQEVAERIPDVRLGRGLGSRALRAHPVVRRAVRPAVDALVAEALRHVDGRLLRVGQGA